MEKNLLLNDVSEKFNETFTIDYVLAQQNKSGDEKIGYIKAIQDFKLFLVSLKNA